MPVNQSDVAFFELLVQMTQNFMAFETPSIETMRKGVKMFSGFADDPADIAFEDRKVTASKGHTIRLRYYSQGKIIKPLIIYFPGNAFIHDLFDENHAIISKIAHYSGCHAVMVECRLAPENPYPAPLEDALDAVNFVFDHLPTFYADPAKIILAGFSSGANLAAVVTNQYRKNKAKPIYHQFLMSGGYDYTNSLHEYDAYALQDKMLDPNSAQVSFDAYCQESQRKESRCSPYWEKDLSGLPPTTIMVGEYDGGRSQSEGYAKRLIEAGNIVEKLILPGQTHGTILYRRACSDGEDPAVVAGMKIREFNEKGVFMK